ncbi:hypothetical protein AB0I81_53120 [Nonomuraea sp. NPDC050404]|uniref:hypothetical protein n=1 Tax=Nonomuraea sp. NPDC050404 TaxID=3155783 RepID=UPI003401E512
MSLELPAALAPMELFLERLFPGGDEEALLRLGDEHAVLAEEGDRAMGLGLKVSAGLVLAHKGLTLLQYGLTAAALAEALATGGAPAPLVREAGQRALDTAATVAVHEVHS